MTKEPNAYRKNFDSATFKEIRPAASGLMADNNAVYLSGFRFWEGDDWKDVEAGIAPVKGIFKHAKCKKFFTEANVQYSHKAIINEDTQWGMACYYVPLAGVDSKSFKYIKPSDKSDTDSDGFYFRDKDHVFYLNSDKDAFGVVPCSSPDDFSVLNIFATDAKNAFFKGKRIAKSDASSFSAIKAPYEYQDDNFFYKNDNWGRVKATPKA